MNEKKLTRRDFLRMGALTAASAALAGCAKPAPQEGPAEEPTVEPTAVPAGPESVKITMWFHDFLYVQFFTDRSAEYAEMHPEYEFEFDIVQIPEIADKFIGTLVAGTGAPDLVGIEQGWMPRLFKGGLAERGMYDLNPWMELEGAGFKDKFLRWELYSYAGKTYGVESALCPCVYYYNKEIFDQVGIDPNTFETYDDFIDAGQVLKKETGSYMLPIDTAGGGYGLLFMLQNDGNLFDDKGEVILDSSQNIEVLQFYYDLAYKNEAGWATSEFWGASMSAAYLDGTVAGVIGPDWYADYVMKEPLEEMAGKWRAAIMPVYKPGGRRTSVWGGTGMGVTKQSGHPDITWEILKYTYMTKENQVKRYLEIHYFPTMLDALEDPRIVEAEDPFFGDQLVGAVFAEVAPEVPVYYSSPYKAEALQFLNEAFVPVMAGEQKPEDALKDAADRLKDQIASEM
jgi:ABC-type glycerol-3-phosphate transport system substrate-binding protein